MVCGVHATTGSGVDSEFLKKQAGEANSGNVKFGGIFMADKEAAPVKNNSGSDSAGILAFKNSDVVTHDAIEATPEALRSRSAREKQLLEQCQLLLGFGNSRVSINS